MFRRSRPRFDHTTVVAYLALFVALGGSAYAATRINGRTLVDRSVAARKLEKHAITRTEINRRTVAALRGARGPRGVTGATGLKGDKGTKGDAGQRGPSDVYEVVPSNSSVTQNADQPLSIALTQLPPGTYAIFAKASLGPLTNNPGRDTGQCRLTAGSDVDRAIDDWEVAEQSFKTIDASLTHTFSSPGTVTMTCTITTEKYEMGLGAPDDTRIVAVRVDKATNRTAPIG